MQCGVADAARSPSKMLNPFGNGACLVAARNCIQARSAPARGAAARGGGSPLATEPGSAAEPPDSGGVMSNGQSIVIKGDISGGEDLVIAGRVEGSITLNGRVLTLAAGSHVVGEVEAGMVIVSGKMNGTIEAKDRLDIKSTAEVQGQLSTAKPIIADGSQMKAKMRDAGAQGAAGGGVVGETALVRSEL